jgi:hypothetical protein
MLHRSARALRRRSEPLEAGILNSQGQFNAVTGRNAMAMPRSSAIPTGRYGRDQAEFRRTMCRQFWPIGTPSPPWSHGGCCMCQSRSCAATRLSLARRSPPPGPLGGRRTMNSRTSSKDRAVSILLWSQAWWNAISTWSDRRLVRRAGGPGCWTRCSSDPDICLPTPKNRRATMRGRAGHARASTSIGGCIAFDRYQPVVGGVTSV